MLEGRIHPRFDVNIPCSYLTVSSPYSQLGEGPRLSGTVVNISSGGILLTCQEPLSTSSWVAVEFKLDEIPMQKAAQVVWSHEIDNITFYGCQFTEHQAIKDLDSAFNIL